LFTKQKLLLLLTQFFFQPASGICLKAEKKEKLANSVETMGGAKCATVRIGVDDNMRRESCSSVRLQIIKLISYVAKSVTHLPISVENGSQVRKKVDFFEGRSFSKFCMWASIFLNFLRKFQKDDQKDKDTSFWAPLTKQPVDGHGTQEGSCHKP
jgi:hypothetical protein